jgi:Cu(I)/Ag(I) efflux system membrane protein CusA/SilA
MLLSFLPVLTLGGLEGKMFRPLALTKSLALLGAAVVAITLVPALCTLFIRGRMRGERESGIVRGLADVYLPTLRYLMERPAALLWVTGAIFILGLAPLGWRWHGYPWPILGALSLFGGMIWLHTPSRLARGVAISTLLLVALFADRNIQPLESEFLSPLDEGTVMDMPITVPAISITQAADDLKARDMVLCRFPEVEMVMGKVGRAETPTDPAPVDMIETMVSFHPPEFWPRRSLASQDATRVLERVYAKLVERQLIEPAADEDARRALLANCQGAIVPKFHLVMREVAYQRNQELLRSLGNELAITAARSALAQLRRQGVIASTTGEGEAALVASRFPPDLLAALGQAVAEPDVRRCERLALQVLQDQKLLDESLAPKLDLFSVLVARRRGIWKEHLRKVDADLQSRAPGALVHLALEDLTSRCRPLDRELAAEVERLRAFRLTPPKASRASGGHHGGGARPLTRFEPAPVLDGLQQQLADELGGSLLLVRKARKELVGFGGELDQAVQMPGWTNVWTMPIQNRVDMLATGVNSTIGIRVLGERLEDVLTASDRIAEILRQVPGATQVVADPVRGKGYLDIELDRRAAGQRGVSIADANDVIQAALGGKVAGRLDADRRRFDLRVSFPAAATEDLDAIRRLPVPREPAVSATPVALGDIATVRFSEGPAAIKSEKGVLRNYVRANVRDRDVLEFLQEAQQVVEQRAQLPKGVFVEWTGQFEHQLRARRRLWIVGPCVLLIILSILYFTYRDWMDALLVVPAVAGALAGGLFLQWLLGFGMSVTVAVGFLACFGMAAATGIIMLVYLRDAVERAGGLANISLPELREAVLEGAVHRLRPKLLTEATTILGLAPMLWASGVGAEVIRPMAAPVLGGILIADEVIDLLLPVAFYWVRRARWQRLHGETAEPSLLTSDEAPDVSAA